MPVKRQYDGTRRKAQAAATRRAVLEAAHDLFVDQGYARTTVAEVAARAGVSVETVYGAFKSKVSLLHRVWDVTVGGDDQEVLFHERPEVLAMRAEPDLAARLGMHARFATATARRIAPLMRAVAAAAGADQSAAAMRDEMDRQRLAGLTIMAAEAAKTGQLGVPEDVCRDLLWAMTDGMLWHRLVMERGWTDEQFAQVLETTWVSALVDARQAPSAARSVDLSCPTA